jgi:uncharacterized UPF0160 family protein
MTTDKAKAAVKAFVDGKADPDVERRMERLRQALEQPEQEPVAWMVSPAITIMPNFAFCCTKTKMHTIPLYTAPPKRKWVGLTDEEIIKWWASENGLEDCNMCVKTDFIKVARAIEAKLMEKNT